VLLYENPDLVHNTMEFLLECQIRLGIAQLEAGAHAILLCDLNCSSRLVSPNHYTEFVFDVNRRLVAAIHDAGGMLFHHPNDPDPGRLSLMAGIGSDVITVGDGADIVEVKQRMDSHICLMGNVDPLPFFLDGTPADMEREVKRIIDGISAGGGHILSSGAAIPVESKPENVEALVQTTRRHWAASDSH
jgi:uroporphyrinogen decarboxylase